MTRTKNAVSFLAPHGTVLVFWISGPRRLIRHGSAAPLSLGRRNRHLGAWMLPLWEG
jgi:hypothetical protein